MIQTRQLSEHDSDEHTSAIDSDEYYSEVSSGSESETVLPPSKMFTELGKYGKNKLQILLEQAPSLEIDDGYYILDEPRKRQIYAAVRASGKNSRQKFKIGGIPITIGLGRGHLITGGCGSYKEIFERIGRMGGILL